MMYDQIPFVYANFMGIIDGVGDSGKPVVCTQNPSIIVRDSRAPAVDGLWPDNIFAEHARYLQWCHKRFGHD
jgi:hypothetical protein